MEEQNIDLPEENAPVKKTGIAAVDWIREKFSLFQSLTKKNADDNVWILGIKVFFQILMVLFLIAISPFALFAIMVSIMVTG